MRNLVLLLPLFLFLSSCASYKANKKAVNQCHIDIDTYYLKDLSLEQLECIEEAGKTDPNFVSLKERIEKKKRDLQVETEKSKLSEAPAATSIKILSANTTSPAGGTVRVEGEASQENIEAVMGQFCRERKMTGYKILKTQLGKTEGTAATVYSDLSFECVK
ncbi:hypothetical protein AZI86_10535 [Bdellovibrio bacteriovorus]|uniref:Lipoprotein n=1 Tax=Bdellovibrio bacteriovorus TaxID=959 RepID=A0A150WL30_BDEBC|nr:hypothetical protein [Bdellovibrio bacteriovorus]KYG64644.1 hypothetical protein AZI86_10535 [Bdellovibrio bacteriovorus]